MKVKHFIYIALILLVIYYLSKPLGRSSNEAYIMKMKPYVRNDVRRFLRDIEALGYEVKIRDSTRTFEEQQYYKKINPKNATPGHSTHEKGIAIDFDIYKNGKVLSKKTNKNIWISSGVPQLAKEYGISWGGNFKNYADNNHFYF